MIHADARTRDSIWMGVSLALSCLADPRVLDAVTPRAGEHFDPTEFLTGNGTLYLLATGAGRRCLVVTGRRVHRRPRRDRTPPRGPIARRTSQIGRAHV